LPRDFEVMLTLERAGQTKAENRMVVNDAYADASATWPFQSPPDADQCCLLQTDPPPAVRRIRQIGVPPSSQRPKPIGTIVLLATAADVWEVPGIWLQEFELGAVARWEVLLGDVFFTPAFC